MKPELLAQIIFESGLHQLQLLGDAIDKQLDDLHQECERDYLQDRFYWVQWNVKK